MAGCKISTGANQLIEFFYKDTLQMKEFPNKLEQIQAQHSPVTHFVNFVIKIL